MGERRLSGWLQLLRIVNLPTVPGDVFAGLAVVLASVPQAHPPAAASVIAAALAACCLYLFGLVDNDLVGEATDGLARPIPAGAVSRGAARWARGLFLFAVPAFGAAADLPSAWWLAAAALALCIVVYNRTKSSLAMGLCRGLDVACGGALCATGAPSAGGLALGAAAVVWTLYIAGVTRYSEGEAEDPAKRRRVGRLLGGLVYLQLAVLLVAFEAVPSVATRGLLLAGAALLVALRLLRRLLPQVSAS